MKWLDEEVVGAQLHGFDGAIHHVIGAHHDDDHGRGNLLCLSQHLDPIDSRQHNVEQRQVGLLLGDDLQRLFAIASGEALVALGLQRAADGAQGQRLVIDDEDGMRHG